jgi:hypothetical protein
LLAESLALKQTQKDDRGTAVALMGLGGVSLATGRYEQAATELLEAIQLSQTCGDLKLTLEGLAGLASLAVKQGFLQEGAAALFLFWSKRARCRKCEMM